MRPSVAALLAAALLGCVAVLSACGDDSDPPSGSTTSSATTRSTKDTDGDGVPDADDAAPTDASIGDAKVVTGSLKLEQGAAGPADGGTQAGHHGGEAEGATERATFSFEGIVSPAESQVTVRAATPVSGRVAPEGDHGDFTVKLSNLRPGRNRLTLRATATGYRPWEQDVVITRRR